MKKRESKISLLYKKAKMLIRMYHCMIIYLLFLHLLVSLRQSSKISLSNNRLINLFVLLDSTQLKYPQPFLLVSNATLICTHFSVEILYCYFKYHVVNCNFWYQEVVETACQ